MCKSLTRKQSIDSGVRELVHLSQKKELQQLRHLHANHTHIMRLQRAQLQHIHLPYLFPCPQTQ